MGTERELTSSLSIAASLRSSSCLGSHPSPSSSSSSSSSSSPPPPPSEPPPPWSSEVLRLLMTLRAEPAGAEVEAGDLERRILRDWTSARRS